MAIPVIMPRQGQSVESCILTEWYKEVGDQVSKGDLLFAYETDKASFEEEAPEDGVLLARFFEAGDEVPVLTNAAVIGSKGEAVDEFAPEGAAQQEEAVPEETNPEPVPAAPVPAEVESASPQVEELVSSPSSNGKMAISPRARKLACEKRVLLDGVRGSGPGGRIIEQDIVKEIEAGKRLTPLAWSKAKEDGLGIPCEGKDAYGKVTSKDLQESAVQVEAPSAAPSKAVPAPASAPAPAMAGAYQEIPLSNVRKIIAGAMHASLQNSAQLTHHLSANASHMLQLRKEVKKNMAKENGPNITLNDMVCYAVVRALKAFPEANAQYVNGNIRQFEKVNLGLAVDTERGLLVPALLGADDYSLSGLSSQLKNLVESAREGKVSPDLLAPEMASFTVSNLGNYGVEMFTPVINLPQVGILGVNTIIQRPTAMPDGSLGFQPFIGLSLTYDHRALDGGPATQFLAEIKNQVELLGPHLL